MTMLYVDPLTGESLDEPREGCLSINIPQEEVDQLPDREWLPDHYMEESLKILANKEANQAKYDRLIGTLQALCDDKMADLDREQATLDWRLLARLESVVNREVTGTKKRSMNYTYGKAGFRKSSRTEVTDESAAMEWAAANCPEAVKVTRKLLKSVLPKTETVPGVERHSESTFYVHFPK